MLYGSRAGMMKRKYSPISFPMLICSYHVRHCAQSLQESCGNQVVCLLLPKSLSLNPYFLFLSECFCIHWVCGERSWVPSRVPRSRDTGFLSASVQESNTTNDTQLSSSHFMDAIWLQHFSRGCFLPLEKTIQLCFLLQRCWSSWTL